MAPKRNRARAPQPEADAPSSDAEIEQPSSEASEQVEEDDQEGEGTAPPLKFDEPLSWTAGRAIPVGELLRRLGALYNEIATLQQEDIDLESLRGPAKDLVAQRLIAHKDRGVKAWTACCLVEMIRIFAPNAPFTGKELKVCASAYLIVLWSNISDRISLP
jgi:sister-chromatid-cohesion protein PDS5